MKKKTNIAVANGHESAGVKQLLELVKEPETTDRLSQEHCDLFLPAFHSMLDANRSLQQAQQAFAQAQAQQQAASGALLYIMNHLRPKYEMSPTDDIDQDGVIIRA